MNKKNLRLFVILLALLGLAYLYEGPFQKTKNNWGRPDNFLEKVKADEIYKVEIKRQGQLTTLEKEGDRWRIDGTKGFYVQDSLAKNLEERLDEVTEDDLELVSENPDKKSSFALDEANGVVVKLFWDDKEKEFFVGNLDTNYKNTYISTADDDKTYATKVKLYNVFYYSQWYDKKIFEADIEKVSKVRFQYPDREFTIEKKDDKWQGTIPYEFEVSEEKAQEITDIMTHLVASGIPAQTFDGTGLEKHLIIVQATGEGIDNTLMIGEANEDGFYYAKKGSSDNIYLISEDKKEALDKIISDLK